MREHERGPNLGPNLGPNRGAAGAAMSEVSAFGANPGALRMFAYAPPAPRAPLVVLLHGCGQTAAAYAHGAGWLDLAARHGFALLAPEQTKQNNLNGCFNWFTPEDVARTGGEAESIRAMIGAMIDAHALDPARVYVTGLSAGGAMSVALLAAYPEVFAAGAAIAGLAYRSAETMQQALGAMMQGRKRPPEDWGARVRAASPHAGPWPRISIWHGTGDVVVNALNAEAIAQQWLDLHGLVGAPPRRDAIGLRTRTVWGEAGAPAVELNYIAGMAHGVPITLIGEEACGAAGPFFCEAGISSSRELARAWGLAAPARAAAPPAPKKRFHFVRALAGALKSIGLTRR
jgi:feruloyl esterase